MKVCPKCGAVSVDDTQRFCLMDGSELVHGDSEPTVVIPTQNSLPTAVVQQKRKRSPFLWVVLGLFLLLIIGGIVVGVAIYSYKLGTDKARNDRTENTNINPARNSMTPVKTSSSPSPSPSAETTTSPVSSPMSDTAEEATPIEWTTAASGFKEETGKTYKFLCPPGGAEAIIWGSDIYTADSSICTAAVHASVITMEAGGEVIIEFRPGRQVYGSTTRNGVTSKNYGEYPHSYVVRKP
jgi:hypothetical protein